jgi:hypothetical protein
MDRKETRAFPAEDFYLVAPPTIAQDLVKACLHADLRVPIAAPSGLQGGESL